MMKIGEVRARRDSRRIATALLAVGCTLVTVASLCFALSWVGANYQGQLRLLEPYRSPNGDEAAALIPVDYALTSDEANDVVFVGGSTCRCGLDPRLFEKLSGLRAFNLGSSGSLGLAGQLVTLRTYLDHHPTPRAVVLCISPIEILRVQPGSGDAALAPGTSAGMLCERFLRVYGSPDQRKSVLADGTSSLRYFINRGMSVSKAWWTDWLEGSVPDRLDDPLYGLGTETYRTLRDKSSQRRGFFPLPKDHSATVVDLLALEEPHSVVPWVNEGVREFAALAGARSFRLVIRLGPLSVNQAPWDRECLPAWSKQLETELPQVSVSRPEILWYEPDLCWDSIHLNSRGVERFTAHAAQDVGSFLASRPSPAAQAGFVAANSDRP